MSDGRPGPISKTLRIQWSGVEAVPILMANQFLAQIDSAGGEQADQLILAVGQLTPPAVLGTVDEQRAALETVSEISVQTLARYSISPARLRELIKLLETVEKAFAMNDRTEGRAVS